MVLDRLDTEQHSSLIVFIRSADTIRKYQTMIESMLKDMFPFSDYIENITTYYDNAEIKKDKSIISYQIFVNVYNYNIAKEQVIHEFDNKYEDKENNPTKKKMNKYNIYAMITYAKNRKIEFKLFDYNRYTELKTKDDKISESSMLSGRTCETFTKHQILEIFKTLNIDDEEFDRNQVGKKNFCSFLEVYFRHSAEHKKNELWLRKTAD